MVLLTDAMTDVAESNIFNDRQPSAGTSQICQPAQGNMQSLLRSAQQADQVPSDNTIDPQLRTLNRVNKQLSQVGPQRRATPAQKEKGRYSPYQQRPPAQRLGSASQGHPLIMSGEAPVGPPSEASPAMTSSQPANVPESPPPGRPFCRNQLGHPNMDLFEAQQRYQYLIYHKSLLVGEEEVEIRELEKMFVQDQAQNGRGSDPALQGDIPAPTVVQINGFSIPVVQGEVPGLPTVRLNGTSTPAPQQNGAPPAAAPKEPISWDEQIKRNDAVQQEGPSLTRSPAMKNKTVGNHLRAQDQVSTDNQANMKLRPNGRPNASSVGSASHVQTPGHNTKYPPVKRSYAEKFLNQMSTIPANQLPEPQKAQCRELLARVQNPQNYQWIPEMSSEPRVAPKHQGSSPVKDVDEESFDMAKYSNARPTERPAARNAQHPGNHTQRNGMNQMQSPSIPHSTLGATQVSPHRCSLGSQRRPLLVTATEGQ